MKHEILYRPSYSLVKVGIKQGESVSAEAGAMVSMSSTIEMQTAAKGGIFGALKRSVLGGESFFVNTFNATGSGEVTLAPTLPGDVQALELTGPGKIMIQTRSADAFLSWLIPQLPKQSGK